MTDVLYVAIFPELAAAALKQRCHRQLAHWAILRASDEAGRGWIERPAAVRILADARQITRRSAQAAILSGVGQFWTVGRLPGAAADCGREDCLWLRSPAKVAESLGLNRMSAHRLVPIAEFRGGAARLRGAINAAAVYQPVERADRATPLTRRKVATITGVPPSTQRRLDRAAGVVGTPVYVSISDTGREQARRIADEHHVWGFFYRPATGRLIRRHGDIRQASRHHAGTRSGARAANRKLAGAGRPLLSARGERPVRAYFRRGGKVPPAVAWLRSQRALGKPISATFAFDAALDYSVIEVTTQRGHRAFEAVRGPHDMRSN